MIHLSSCAALALMIFGTMLLIGAAVMIYRNQKFIANFLFQGYRSVPSIGLMVFLLWLAINADRPTVQVTPCSKAIAFLETANSGALADCGCTE